MNLDVDHLVLGAADLAEGVDWVANRLGTVPVPGGRHPGMGTHNALLGLGSAYLEILAPDPAQRLSSTAGSGLSAFHEPMLLKWAVSSSDGFRALLTRARSTGYRVARTRRGHRRAPDGTGRSWQISELYGHPFGRVVPFFIEFDPGSSPAPTLPQAGRLSSMRIQHPKAEELSAVLLRLGVDCVVTDGSRPRLHADIVVHDRIVTLSG